MIKFSNWTAGKHLRAPVFLGLRDDVQPAAVRCANAPDSLLSGTANEASLTLDRHPLKFTNLNKVFYPDDGYTKRDLLNYYDAVADLILPHLKDRPLSLKRYPNGIDADIFFQKDMPANLAPVAAHESRSVPSTRIQARGPSTTSSPKTAPACSIWSTWAASTRTPG